MEIFNNINNDKIKDIDIYFNMIGGHNSFFNIFEGIILKAADITEMNFYRLIENLNKNSKKELTSSIFPKCFGFVNKKNMPQLIKLIENILSQYDYLFRNIILQEIQNDPNFIKNLNLENDYIFDDKLKLFLEKNENSIEIDQNNLNILENKIYSLGVDKMNWILFWYIKRRNVLMIKEDFIILEDLTYGMKLPAILDLKLGFNLKKNRQIKVLPDSIFDYGFRIMGLQAFKETKEKTYFKNRYECKKFTNEDLKKEILNYFILEGKFLIDLIKLIVKKLKYVIERLKEINLLDIPFVSILIIYDADYFDKFEFNNYSNLDEENSKKIIEQKLNIKLIDFSFYDDNQYNSHQGDSVDAIESLILYLSSLI